MFLLSHIIKHQYCQRNIDHKINIQQFHYGKKSVAKHFSLLMGGVLSPLLSSQLAHDIIDHRKQQTSINHYQEHEPYIRRMMIGKKHQLLIGGCKRFAKTSGTTGLSKYLPVTQTSLKINHFKAGRDLMSRYCLQNQKTKIFEGKALVIGGGFEENPLRKGIYNVGYISAILQYTSPMIGKLLRTPSTKKRYDRNRLQKLEYIASHVIKEPITCIGGLPSWGLSILEYICERHHQSDISSIRPTFELFISGGMNTQPFEDRFFELFGSNPCRIWQAYNASEGFFACQIYNDDPRMLLLTHHGIYYEFISVENYELKKRDTCISLANVKVGIPYVMVITTCAGLWRYVIGDIIEFCCTDPYLIKITGRTSYRMSLFDERVTGEDIQQALLDTCKTFKAQVRDYSVTTRRIGSIQGYHHRAIEFISQPENIELFTQYLDDRLQTLREDYAYVRQGDRILLLPQITCLTHGTCSKWMESKGKLGGQHKLPKISTDTSLVDELCMIHKQI